MDADPEELIRLYSYQHPEAWVAAQNLGYLTGSHGHEPDVFWDFPYEWMRRAMADRIPDFSGDLPVWAWLKRENGKKRIKDPYTRITALVPRKRILASCYDMWHMHLNNGFIYTSDAESEEYDALYPKTIPPGKDPDYQAHTERHWDMVFDIREAREGYMLKNHGFLERIQLCVDRIYVDEVVEVKAPKS